jgi:dipeptidyl aminopeptidase/acylaminoacyl peptidase
MLTISLAVVAAAFVIYLIARPGPRAAPTAHTLIQLTSQAGEESFPTLSPDGDFVAYVSAASGNLDIYLLRVGGENEVNLTADSGAADTQPAFSPDGEQMSCRLLPSG